MIARAQQAALASIANLKAQTAKVREDIQKQVNRVRTMREKGYQRAIAGMQSANKLLERFDNDLNDRHIRLLEASEKEKENYEAWLEDKLEKLMEELVKATRSVLDDIQLTLDIFGFVPGVGEIFDALNGLIYLARGNYVDAFLSFGSMFTIVGDILFKGGRLAAVVIPVIAFGGKYQDETAAIIRRSNSRINVSSSPVKIYDSLDDTLGDIAKQTANGVGAAAKKGSGKTVLGSYPDYLKLADELDAKRFNIPIPVWKKMSKTEQWAANKKFLDRAIARGDDIVLSNSFKTAEEGTAFFDELEYLWKKGYRPSKDGFRMIPPLN